LLQQYNKVNLSIFVLECITFIRTATLTNAIRLRAEVNRLHACEQTLAACEQTLTACTQTLSALFELREV
jgi:hypothetical protein